MCTGMGTGMCTKRVTQAATEADEAGGPSMQTDKRCERVADDVGGSKPDLEGSRAADPWGEVVLYLDEVGRRLGVEEDDWDTDLQ